MRRTHAQRRTVRRCGSAMFVAGAVFCMWLLPAASHAAPDAAERAYVEAYIQGLVDLGVLTQQQADQLRTKAEAAAAAAVAEEPAPKPEWTDTTKIGGYVHFRWNDLPDASESLGDPTNDFEVRRGRIKVEAKPTDRLKGTIQVDLPLGDGQVEVKDAFGDLFLDDSHESWVRFGQSKVPFGFEIPQSSSRRLTFERSDARRRMVPGERDLGVWFFHTPERLHERFEALKHDHLGTGDFGLFALGFYEGQGINTSDANDDKHLAARFDYPFELGCGRMGQAGVSFFTGEYVSGDKKVTVADTTATVPSAEIDEHAVNFHFYLPPDPWGVQFEYLTGETVALFTPDPDDPATWFVGQADVDGWYGQVHAKVGSEQKDTLFARYDEMNGFRKRGLGSLPSANDMDRWSLGWAHECDSKTELTVEYDDVTRNGKDDDFFGVQMQYKY